MSDSTEPQEKPTKVKKTVSALKMISGKIAEAEKVLKAYTALTAAGIPIPDAMSSEIARAHNLQNWIEENGKPDTEEKALLALDATKLQRGRQPLSEEDKSERRILNIRHRILNKANSLASEILALVEFVKDPKPGSYAHYDRKTDKARRGELVGGILHDKRSEEDKRKPKDIREAFDTFLRSF